MRSYPACPHSRCVAGELLDQSLNAIFSFGLAVLILNLGRSEFFVVKILDTSSPRHTPKVADSQSGMSDRPSRRYLNARLTHRKKYGSSHLFTARIIENENRIGQRDEKGSREQPNESGFGSKSSSDFYDGASRKGLGVYCPM